MGEANTLDQLAYRQALRQFTTGIAVVTTATEDGERIGVTINSLNSVSLEPPLLLWCLHNNARYLPVFRQQRYFCVSILAADQAWLSDRFAAPASAERFAGVECAVSRFGPPLLAGASAHFLCQQYCTYGGGDHRIFMGNVLEFHHDTRPPLLFYRGRYAVMNTPMHWPGGPPHGASTYADFEFA